VMSKLQLVTVLWSSADRSAKNNVQIPSACEPLRSH
jgi:hypothetical protein